MVYICLYLKLSFREYLKLYVKFGVKEHFSGVSICSYHLIVKESMTLSANRLPNVGFFQATQ